MIPQVPLKRLRQLNTLYQRKNNTIGLWTGTAWKCEHQRVRSKCKECGGSSICEHQRQRSQCKECGGGSICEHQRRRAECKECGGGSICEHQRRRAQCIECGGSGICEHQRQRSQCIECSGSGICEHQRQRYQCIECGGGRICKHQRQRSKCKECGGSGICKHQRQRSQCKECSGSSICEHQRVRSKCIECGGGSICEHQRQRSQCKECITTNKAIQSAIWCTVCCQTMLSDRRRRTTGICAGCDPSVPPQWQQIVWDLIKSRVPIPSISDDQMLGGKATCASARTRPDWCWVLPDRIVHLENDEDSHTDREVACELKKNDSANWGLDNSVAHRPTVVVRFNCNAYDGHAINLEDRCDRLVSVLDDLFHCDLKSWSLFGVNVVYMYYHSKAAKHISAARAAVGSVRVLDVVE